MNKDMKPPIISAWYLKATQEFLASESPDLIQHISPIFNQPSTLCKRDNLVEHELNMPPEYATAIYESLEKARSKFGEGKEFGGVHLFRLIETWKAGSSALRGE